MEIKTCEQYVLNRLVQAETDVESLKVDNMAKDAQIDELKAELDNLKKFLFRCCKESTTSEGDRYIDIDEPWEKYDLNDFNFILEILKEKEREEN